MARIFKPSKGKSSSKKPRNHRAGATSQRDFEVLRYADDGRGIAIDNGKVVFIDGALPGEKVHAELIKTGKRFDEARCLSVHSPSPLRVEPTCGVYQHCGGCQLQHLNYPGQLEYKQQRLQKIIAGIADDVAVGAMPSTAFGYRHRARLSYRLGHLGFRRRASHEVENFVQCPVLMPELEGAIDAVRGPLLAALKPSKSAELHFALGTTATGEVAVGLSLEDQAARTSTWCMALAKALAPAVMLQRVSSVGGEWCHPEAMPLNYDFSFRHADTDEADSSQSRGEFFAGDFTQVNPAINQRVVEQCLSWLKPQAGDLIADFFCGLGNFSFPLAQCGARVVAMDAGAAMIERARQVSARYPGEPAINFHLADLFDEGQIALPKGINKAVLDPPRAGAKALCQRLAGHKTLLEIVYISCDPATLARDLVTLTEGGWRVQGAISVDMFPQTHHLESMVYLTRSGLK